MKTYKVGDKIKFKAEKQRYTIQACNERFLICTKPFNARKTFIYTLVDLKEGIRGTEGKYCTHDYDNPEEARKALNKLTETLMLADPSTSYFSLQYLAIDSRYSIKLDIEPQNLKRKAGKSPVLAAVYGKNKT